MADFEIFNERVGEKNGPSSESIVAPYNRVIADMAKRMIEARQRCVSGDPIAAASVLEDALSRVFDFAAEIASIPEQ